MGLKLDMVVEGKEMEWAKLDMVVEGKEMEWA